MFEDFLKYWKRKQKQKNKREKKQMRILEVRYERTRQVKQYEPEILGLTAEVGDSDPKEVIKQLRSMVEEELNPTQMKLPLEVKPEEKKDVVEQPKTVEQPKEEKKPRAKKEKVTEAPKEVPPKADKKVTPFDAANADHKKLFLDIAKKLYPEMKKDSPEHLATKKCLQEADKQPFIDENGDVLKEFSYFVEVTIKEELAGSANVTEEATV